MSPQWYIRQSHERHTDTTTARPAAWKRLLNHTECRRVVGMQLLAACWACCCKACLQHMPAAGKHGSLPSQHTPALCHCCLARSAFPANQLLLGLGQHLLLVLHPTCHHKAWPNLCTNNIRKAAWIRAVLHLTCRWVGSGQGLRRGAPRWHVLPALMC